MGRLGLVYGIGRMVLIHGRIMVEGREEYVIVGVVIVYGMAG